MLAIKGLNKSFGENEILKKIDLNIEKGKVIAILGPSGSGLRNSSCDTVIVIQPTCALKPARDKSQM